MLTAAALRASRETGAVGADTEGAATTGGRRSEPYAGNGPAGVAGEPVTGVGGAATGAPITGAADGAPLPPVDVIGAPAPAEVGAAGAWSTAGDWMPLLMVAAGAGGTTGACGACPAPDAAAFITPSDNLCAPAAAG